MSTSLTVRAIGEETLVVAGAQNRCIHGCRKATSTVNLNEVSTHKRCFVKSTATTLCSAKIKTNLLVTPSPKYAQESGTHHFLIHVNKIT